MKNTVEWKCLDSSELDQLTSQSPPSPPQLFFSSMIETLRWILPVPSLAVAEGEHTMGATSLGKGT